MGSLRSLRSESKTRITKEVVIDHIYRERKERKDHPDGSFDNGGRWYPDEDERCHCCSGIRSPSRAFPYSLMSHCRSKKHVKNLVDKQWEDLEQRHILIKRVKDAMSVLSFVVGWISTIKEFLFRRFKRV